MKKQTRRRKPRTVADIGDVFWQICLKDHRNKHSFLTELRNLPSWDSPDLFLDNDEHENVNSKKSRPVSVEETYSGVKHLFEKRNSTDEEIMPDPNNNFTSEINKRQSFRKSIRNIFRRQTFNLKSTKESDTKKKSFRIKMPLLANFARFFKAK